MQANDCRWLDRYFGTVCRNQKTHPNAMRMDDGTIVSCEPTCKRCEGCGYEPITPNTPAWDDDGEDNQ